jgi:O-antigen/teichoic acid export membrane protein
MSLSKTLLRNVASNGVGYAVQVAVAFFLTPFILRSLGETRYGVWTVAVGLMGYYGLLDLGFSAGINQYLTRHLAIKDLDGVNRTASTGVVALGACGVLAFLVSAVIAFNATRLFTVPSNATHEVALVIFIMGASVALQFWFFTYSAVFTALQRFDLSNAIGIVTGLSQRSPPWRACVRATG